MGRLLSDYSFGSISNGYISTLLAGVFGVLTVLVSGLLISKVMFRKPDKINKENKPNEKYGNLNFSYFHIHANQRKLNYGFFLNLAARLAINVATAPAATPPSMLTTANPNEQD